MSAFQGATLGEFSWDPRGPAPFSSTNYKEGRDSSPSLLGLPGPIDIPAPGFGINREKWSPASSHSGITEREDHSSYEEKRVNRSPVTFQDKPILKESVGEGSSFFNMAPMHQELQPLEPLPAASPTGYGAAMSTSDDFAQYGLYGKNHSLELNPSMMGSRSADVPLSGFMAPDVRAGAGATTAVSKDYDRSYNISAPDYEMSSNNSSGKFGMNDYRVAPNVPNLNVPTNSTVDRSIMNMDSESLSMHQQQQWLQRKMGQDRQDAGFRSNSAQPNYMQARPTVPYQSNSSRPVYDVPYNIPNPSARIAQHMYSNGIRPNNPPAPMINPQGPARMSAPMNGDYFRGNPQQPQSIMGGGVQSGLPYGYGAAAGQSYPAASGRIYQVQFKGTVRFFILGSQASPTIAVGEFVVVEADRGEDVGIVTDILPMKTFIERRYMTKTAIDDEDSTIGRIVRTATMAERQQLPEKFHDEQNVTQFCRELAHHTYRLPLIIQDAEYQFDRHKLTIYYHSDSRVDFRELVRDLFSAFKARIWMKKINPHQPYRLDANAQMALASGMHFAMEKTIDY